MRVSSGHMPAAPAIRAFAGLRLPPSTSFARQCAAVLHSTIVRCSAAEGMYMPQRAAEVSGSLA